MKKIRFVVFAALVLLLAGSTGRGNAYQEIEVKNGGTLQGKVVLEGAIPQPRVYHLVLFPNIDMCAQVDTDDEMNRILNDFIVGPERGLKDVVISIEHVDAGKPFPNPTIELVAEHCKFLPEVNVIPQGGRFTVDNQDAVMHNSQVYQSERGKIILNIPIPAEEISDGLVHFQKNYKLMQMICGMHEFMQTWGYRVQNPYNYITNENGNFKIENLPPGDYVVNAWHYLMQTQHKKIHVSENSVVNVNFEFEGEEVIRPLYETIRSGRIKKNARPHEKNPNKF